MLKKILPIVLGAMVTLGITTAADAGPIKITLKCNTGFDWAGALIFEFDIDGFQTAVTQTPPCPFEGSSKFKDDSFPLEPGTREILIVAIDDTEAEACLVDQFNSFEQSFNAKGKCPIGDGQFQIKFKDVE
jgi:hypothetical protein